MAEHEPSIGATSEWFTPPEYFEPNLALSRRKQGFESPRERRSNQALVSERRPPLLHFSNFSPNSIVATGDRLRASATFFNSLHGNRQIIPQSAP